MDDLRQPNISKLMDNYEHEGRELIEYALTSVLVSLVVALILSSTDEQFVKIWNSIFDSLLL